MAEIDLDFTKMKWTLTFYERNKRKGRNDKLEQNQLNLKLAIFTLGVLFPSLWNEI